MVLKLLVVVGFIVILGALAKAGLSMLRGGTGAAKKGAMVRALTVRIAVSVVLFACILIAYKFGWIHPTGIKAGT